MHFSNIITALVVLTISTHGHSAIKILNPRDGQTTTTRQLFNVLGKVDPASSVTVNGVQAAVFSTGIFVRDQLPLQLGANTISIVAGDPSGKQEKHDLVIERLEPPIDVDTQMSTDTLVIDTESIEPSTHTSIRIGEPFQISFKGTPGCRAECELRSGRRIAMTEEEDPDSTAGTGIYRGVLLPTIVETSAPLTLRIEWPEEKRLLRGGIRYKEVRTSGSLEVRDRSFFRLARVKEDFGLVSHGIHDVRLGGPYLAELSSGTLLKVIGQRGRNLHVELTRNIDGWISENEVEMISGAQGPPHLSFTSVSVDPGDGADVLTIPYRQRVPFTIIPTTAPGGNAALDVEFFGAHHASTWNSHRGGLHNVREVSVDQLAQDHLRVRAELNRKQLWGWRYEVTSVSLRIFIRDMPEFAPAPQYPLAGLKVAVEAGHGGDDNGARGVSGSREKDINRMTATQLADALTSAGAEVVMIRVDDETVSHPVRARRVLDSGAHIFVSVHANSAGSDRGYLAVSGTSTYYKYSFCRDYAAAIHEQLLARLGIRDFGNVGNFNYSPLRRVTWMPTVLVEQAFMSNPADEALMLDPAFRQKIVDSIMHGTENWIRGL